MRDGHFNNPALVPGRRRFLRRFLGHSGAAAAVEFAFIAPILVMITFAVLETGRALFVKNSLQHGLERASRYAMVHSSATSTELKTLAFDQVTALSGGSSNVRFTMTNTTVDSLPFVVLQAEIDHQMDAPSLSSYTFVITASTRYPVDT